ncbi:TPA: hypothetical protein DEO28_02565 [Candidatus Dependentiae bacterium]|nr:MAG: hypothetical protein UR14_C0005G0130 [candidate division TM6 bacterium GW2011_GWE2_31_21]KKP53207.1 MAG: hypothetical protein UR43_C0007G0131 [candidate division TM6 bacterium GW2011_GWF2_33_332]HBS48025.1 hypothetical protein [Candidatus Dependentiae bacterium]HBZ73371.1 hypothetical protein [Candidatus Dependentiae bacterium]
MKKFNLKIYISLLIITTLFIYSLLNAGNIVYNLAGGVLDLTSTQSFYIPAGDSYTIKNGQVNNILANSIIMHDSTSQLILQNVTLCLNNDYTMTQGSMLVKGDCEIASNNYKFTTQGHYILIDDNATLKFNNTTFVMQPTQKNVNLVIFSNNLSNLYLLDSTLKVDYIDGGSTISCDNCPVFAGGKLIIDGNCTVDNASTYTMNALQLGVSLTAEDCVLQIKDGSELTINNAGMIINNAATNSLDLSGGNGVININSGANFEVLNSMDLDSSSLDFNFTSTNFFTGTSLSMFNNTLGTTQTVTAGIDCQYISITTSNQFIATASEIYGSPVTIRVFNFSGASVTSTNFASSTYDVEWSPDGKYLAAGGDKGTGSYSTRIYSFNGSLSAIAGCNKGVTNNVRSIAWSRDEKYLAVADGYTGTPRYLTIYGFNGTTLDQITTVSNETTILKVAWSPNGKYLAVGSYSDTVPNIPLRIYSFDGSTLTLKSSITDATFYCYSISWSPNGKYLFCGTGTSGVVKLYFFDGNQLTLVGNDTLSNVVFSTDWCPKSSYVMAADTAKHFKMWKFNGSTLTTAHNNILGLDVTSCRNNYSNTNVIIAPELNALSIYPLNNSNITSYLSLQDATLGLNKNISLWNKTIKSV